MFRMNRTEQLACFLKAKKGCRVPACVLGLPGSPLCVRDFGFCTRQQHLDPASSQEEPPLQDAGWDISLLTEVLADFIAKLIDDGHPCGDSESLLYSKK